MSNADKLLKIKEMAISNGGRCLSEIYINNRSKLLFECKNFHKWETCWKNINKKAWCPKCAIENVTGKNNKKFLNITSCQKIAFNRGGKCLSSEYLGANIKLKWECNLKHIWESTPNNIKFGSWCPKCSIGIGERICKLIFESIFKEEFIKIRPDWLKNSSSRRNLELDGYCSILNIAFEYNGEQHYSNNEYYSMPKYDNIKIQKCMENNTRLFSIKGIKSAVYYKDIINQILEQSKLYNIIIDNNIDISINNVYKNNNAFLALEKLKKIAISNGGVCLSDSYIDNSFKLSFKCGKCNYIWKSSPNSIKNGNWCPFCANKIKSINDAINLAINKNGKCLSINYINSNSKLEWQCSLDHIWKASYNQIQSGNWCPICFSNNRGKSKKLKIDVYKNAARNKGGECLSDVINSCYDKLQWKCNKDHIWFSRADAVKNTKQWCPQCAILNKRKL